MSQVAYVHNYISIEEYLQGESISEIKHEYVDGEVFAMTGASLSHNRISRNIFGTFIQHLKDSSCEPFSQDMKLKLENEYRYPDVMVVCDKDFKDNNYSTQTPVIIVEVLSRSTRKIDTTDKIKSYLKIPTLQEYVLIEQGIAVVEIMRKSNNWQSERFYLGDEVCFDSIALTLAVSEVYDRVENEDVTDFLAEKKLAELAIESQQSSKKEA
ncbi:MAG: Uma2 family endonuclease [Pseudomonadota bacterium]